MYVRVPLVVVMASTCGVLNFAACGQSRSMAGTQEGPRTRLTVEELKTSGVLRDAPIDNLHLAPAGDSDVALHELEGTLVARESSMRASVPDSQLISLDQSYFPGFAVDFFTHEGHLVPTTRDIIRSSGDESHWSFILAPGRVWSEPGDAGRSRAALPFVFVADQFNEVHNGIVTFVFDDERVSSAYFQVTQETAAWNQIDFWGLLPLEYAPGEIKNRDSLIAAYTEELEQQIPVRPWSELETRYGAERVAGFDAGIDSLSISVSGLVFDSVIYLQPCRTRHGTFPFCRHMRHAAFSITKPLGAALTLLRLAEKYGEEVFDLRISDYVAVTANHDGWEGVTFGDALNMATGVGDNAPERREPNVMQGDEDQPKFFSFLQAPSRKDKLEICFSYADYPWGPGEIARYNSCNTFLLAAALDSLVRSREGPTADVWDLVVEEVLQPIGVGHAPIMRTIEPDGANGIPIFGYGLYPNVSDMARITRLLQNGGVHDGRQLLHAGKLAEALFRTPIRGLPTGESNEIGEITYHIAFNGMPYQTADGSPWHVPFGTGYGGVHVVLVPNGITTFRFADGNAYGIVSMIRVAEAIRGR